MYDSVKWDIDLSIEGNFVADYWDTALVQYFCN